MFSSQEIDASLISFLIIFQQLESELFRLKFHKLSSKILEILLFQASYIWINRKKLDELTQVNKQYSELQMDFHVKKSRINEQNLTL